MTHSWVEVPAGCDFPLENLPYGVFRRTGGAAARIGEAAPRIGVAIGAFADPDFPQPEQSVWTTTKHRWIDLPDGMTAWDANPIRPPGN